jgi:predicted anti-sigma-YlaC factor YlaD
MFWLKGCPRCGGDLYEGIDIYGRYIACLQCSREIPEEDAEALRETLRRRRLLARIERLLRDAKAA